MSYKFYMPTRLIFGENSLQKLHEQNLPFKKALIVMTNGKSLIKFGYLDTLREELNKAGIEYIEFAKVLPNPIREHVMEAASIAKDNNCDVIIGFGGGSAIDSAKATAVMCTNPGDLWDYFEGGSAKNLPYVNKPLPVIAITTTAGTGTEADPWFVISEGAEKLGTGNDQNFPYLSIIDPTLMVTVPKNLTAYQGFDTLFHAMEGYINIRHNDMSDMYALKAIELVAKNLPGAVDNGSNIEYRRNMALANTLAGVVETTSGCTGEHSIEHGLSGFHTNIIHGFGLITISLAYFEHIIESNTVNDRLITMAKALGYKEATKPEDFLTALKNLQVECGVDKLSLKSEGMRLDEIEDMAKHIIKVNGGQFAYDPAPWNLNDIIEVLNKSYR